MGRQLWFAAEYVVVERANSPTREQRRADVVSGMVTIRGLTLPQQTVNITYHITRSPDRSKSVLPPQRSPATPAMVTASIYICLPPHQSQVPSTLHFVNQANRYFNKCLFQDLSWSPHWHLEMKIFPYYIISGNISLLQINVHIIQLKLQLTVKNMRCRL